MRKALALQASDYIAGQLSTQQVSELLKVFVDTSQYFDPRGINKIDNPWDIPAVKSVLQESLTQCGIDTSKCYGDNFYEHDYEYLIHTDFRDDDGASENVLIPLRKEEVPQYFIIFDQMWDADGRTWAQDSKKVYKPNIGLPGRPSDYNEICGLTNAPIPDDLFAYLDEIPHMPRSYFHGLSGTAVPWEPGTIIRYDSRLLHCTGKMLTAKKTGLLLRFPKQTIL